MKFVHPVSPGGSVKFVASGVNFSIFTHFLCFFLLKLLKLGEIDGVKFLTWKSSGVKLWTNSMSGGSTNLIQLRPAPPQHRFVLMWASSCCIWSQVDSLWTIIEKNPIKNRLIYFISTKKIFVFNKWCNVEWCQHWGEQRQQRLAILPLPALIRSTLGQKAVGKYWYLRLIGKCWSSTNFIQNTTDPRV